MRWLWLIPGKRGRIGFDECLCLIGGEIFFRIEGIKLNRSDILAIPYRISDAVK